MLPNNSKLSIIKLSACFNNTSASYKFYWLISIIESIESRNEYQSIIISKKEIIDMLRQRSRPYLFSNSLAPHIVGASIAVLDMLGEATTLRDKLEWNVNY